MIELFTADTPNGHKVSITLEEMAIPYRVRAVNILALEQRQDWFLAINPNGRIPAIIDTAISERTAPVKMAPLKTEKVSRCSSPAPSSSTSPSAAGNSCQLTQKVARACCSG